MQRLQAVLLIVIVVYITDAQGSYCTNLAGNEDNMCSDSNWQSDIIITNGSSTSVLVQWRHYIMNNGPSSPGSNGRSGGITKRQSENEVIYTITYIRTGSNDATQKTEFTTDNSTILVYLLPNTPYCIIVCINNTVNNTCCARNFRTTEQNKSSQVQNVRAHVYYPLLNNKSVISAQVIWTSLPSMLRPSSYEIQIFTANANMLHIEGSPFINLSPADPFKTIEIRNNNNELNFPLAKNTTYIIKVRGTTTRQQYPLSEPIKISTFSHEPAVELYVATSQIGRVLVRPPGSSQILNVSTQSETNINGPIALDKRSRHVFHVKEMSGQRQYVVMKSEIDNPSQSEELYTLTNFKPLAMTYDWIGQKLYIIARKIDNNHLVIISLIDRNLEIVLETVYRGSKEIDPNSLRVEITVNPFEGLLHWTESSTQANSPSSIYRLDLSQNTPSSSLFYNGSLTSALTEDVLRNCLYFINHQPLQITSKPYRENEDNICFGSYSLNEDVLKNIQDAKLNVDDTGIYLIGIRNSNIAQLIYYQFEANPTLIMAQLNNITTFETTSPGTQPLPSIMCLSPDFSNINNRPHPRVISNTTTSILLSWNEPQLPSSCSSQVISRPPLLYRVYVNDSNGEVVSGYSPKLTYNRSINVTGLTSGYNYTISVSARTNYTVRSSNDLLLGVSLIAAPSQDIVPHMSMSTSMTSLTHLTSSISLTSQSPSQLSPSHFTPQSSNNVIPLRSVSLSSLSPLLSQSVDVTNSIRLYTMTTQLTMSSGTPMIHSPSPLLPSSDPAEPLSATLIGGVSGAVVVIIFILIILIMTVIICMKRKKKETMSEDQLTSNHRTNGHVEQQAQNNGPRRYTRQPVNHPFIQVEPDYESNTPATNFGTASVQPYAIPSDSLQEYRSTIGSNKATPSLPREYEVPTLLSSSESSTGNGHSPRAYSTITSTSSNVKDTTVYSNPVGAVNQVGTNPPTYTSLYPPTKNSRHLYTPPISIRRTPSPTPITEASPYSLPISTSPKPPATRLDSSDRYYQPGHISGSQQQLPDDGSQFPKPENPYFVLEPQGPHAGTSTNPHELNNEGRDNRLYFELEQRDPNSCPNVPSTDVPQSGGGHLYFELERQAQTHSDHTYFELENSGRRVSDDNDVYASIEK